MDREQLRESIHHLRCEALRCRVLAVEQRDWPVVNECDRLLDRLDVMVVGRKRHVVMTSV